MEINKVSIIGCGALGVLFASQMLKGLSPGQVRFVADDGRIKRYRGTEFYANSIRQRFVFVGPDEADGPSDLVVFAVKSYGLDDAIGLAKGHIGKDTIIISIMNGIFSEKRIGETYGPAKVIPAIATGMDATKRGSEVNFLNAGHVAFGRWPENDPADIECLKRFFVRAGIEYEVKEDIDREMWWKFMLNIGVNQTSALLKAQYDLFQDSWHAQKIMAMAMREAYEVSERMHIGLKEQDMADAIEVIKTLAPDGRTSMCQDIVAGRPTEVDIFSGALVGLGRECGVPTPVNEFLYHAIKAMESME